MIVSNTTALINFYSIKRLDILESLFDKIFIPEAVEKEILEKEHKFQQISKILKLDKFEIVKIKNTIFLDNLKLELDDGESEAIVLAKELNLGTILLDEVSARNIAKFHGLIPLGTIGCLALAKKKKIIQKIQPVLDEIIQKGNFWIKLELYKKTIFDIDND